MYCSSAMQPTTQLPGVRSSLPWATSVCSQAWPALPRALRFKSGLPERLPAYIWYCFSTCALTSNPNPCCPSCTTLCSLCAALGRPLTRHKSTAGPGSVTSVPNKPLEHKRDSGSGSGQGSGAHAITGGDSHGSPPHAAMLGSPYGARQHAHVVGSQAGDVCDGWGVSSSVSTPRSLNSSIASYTHLVQQTALLIPAGLGLAGGSERGAHGHSGDLGVGGGGDRDSRGSPNLSGHVHHHHHRLAQTAVSTGCGARGGKAGGGPSILAGPGASPVRNGGTPGKAGAPHAVTLLNLMRAVVEQPGGPSALLSKLTRSGSGIRDNVDAVPPGPAGLTPDVRGRIIALYTATAGVQVSVAPLARGLHTTVTCLPCHSASSTACTQHEGTHPGVPHYTSPCTCAHTCAHAICAMCTQRESVARLRRFLRGLSPSCWYPQNYEVMRNLLGGDPSQVLLALAQSHSQPQQSAAASGPEGAAAASRGGVQGGSGGLAAGVSSANHHSLHLPPLNLGAAAAGAPPVAGLVSCLPPSGRGAAPPSPLGIPLQPSTPPPQQQPQTTPRGQTTPTSHTAHHSGSPYPNHHAAPTQAHLATWHGGAGDVNEVVLADVASWHEVPDAQTFMAWLPPNCTAGEAQ